MKPLIMILLAAIVAPVYGQSLAEIARRERERRAQLSSNRAVSSDTLDRPSAPASASPTTATPSEPVASPAAATSAASPPPATPAAKPAEPVIDPVKKWQEENAKIRARARDLQDRENMLLIQLNDLLNQFFAPVTDQSAKSQAEAKITETQKQLDDVRRELAETRTRIQQMDLQGPPQR